MLSALMSTGFVCFPFCRLPVPTQRHFRQRDHGSGDPGHVQMRSEYLNLCHQEKAILLLSYGQPIQTPHYSPTRQEQLYEESLFKHAGVQ